MQAGTLKLTPVPKYSNLKMVITNLQLFSFFLCIVFFVNNKATKSVKLSSVLKHFESSKEKNFLWRLSLDI